MCGSFGLLGSIREHVYSILKVVCYPVKAHILTPAGCAHALKIPVDKQERK
jgi:hypothetical protein